MLNEPLPCPLCGARQSALFHRDKRRDYLHCPCCALVFVAPQYYLTREAERLEYDKHQNIAGDPGYRHFLSRVLVPLLPRLCVGDRGLDFGSGPGPELAQMLREAGMEMQLYDVFYAPDDAVFNEQYDFICATEVVEHLHQPGLELERLWRLLGTGGYLAVMTKLVIGAQEFASWHYKNDPTHVCFFSRETWQWWARENNARLEFSGADVCLLTKVRAE